MDVRASISLTTLRIIQEQIVHRGEAFIFQTQRSIRKGWLIKSYGSHQSRWSSVCVIHTLIRIEWTITIKLTYFIGVHLRTIIVECHSKIHVYPLSWFKFTHILQRQSIIILLFFAGIITMPIYDNTRVQILSLSADRQVVLLLQTILEHQITPFIHIIVLTPLVDSLIIVGIRNLSSIMPYHQLCHRIHQSTTLVVLSQKIIEGRTSLLHPFEVVLFQLQHFRSIAKIQGTVVGLVGGSDVGIEVDWQLFCLCLFGGNDNHTIRCSSSINSHCGCILQYRYLVNLILVDII